MTKIIQVQGTTPHAFQDDRYGAGFRVCNKVKSGIPGVSYYRDTVTGKKCNEAGKPVG